MTCGGHINQDDLGPRCAGVGAGERGGDVDGELGPLFRFRTRNVSTTELIIVMTPHVVRCPADADRILGTEAAKVKVSDIARLLLEAGLAQYERGQLTVQPRPTGFTLFDD